MLNKLIKSIFLFAIHGIVLSSAQEEEAYNVFSGLFNGIGIDEPHEPETLVNDYDFIIIGAGTAGCVIANRLSEVKEWKILLIEAGSSENLAMDIPVLASVLQLTDLNWNYTTEPQESGCLGMANKRCHWPRGRVVGGSSVLHSMMHTRGHRRDYDGWAAAGNDGWDYSQALYYFKKSEIMGIPELANDTKYHSTTGYMPVNYPSFRTKLSKAFLDAGVETGGKVVDYNGENQIGYSYIQFTWKDGFRVSTNRAFLQPIHARKNLHLLKLSFVTKILLDPRSRTAIGVQFSRNGLSYILQPRKEIILSAGTINSPQILMLSGIGPSEELNKFNIPVIADLKVGYNLQDHYALGGLTFVINTTDSIRSERIVTVNNFKQFFSTHTGQVSAPTGTEALAFFNTQNPNDMTARPNLELLFVAGSFVSYPVFRQTFFLDPQLFRKVYRPIIDADTWMVFPMVLLPKSRGRIKLRDANPYSKPLMYANYYSDPHGNDINVTLAGIRKTIELSKTAAFQKHESKLHDIPIPSCAKYNFNTDAYWTCAMKTITTTIYHQCGTCKMGPGSDPDAVVDPRLRVYGINRLRVADASIIPKIPAAHTNAPVMMVAEKAADLIKEDWGKLTREMTFHADVSV